MSTAIVSKPTDSAPAQSAATKRAESFHAQRCGDGLTLVVTKAGATIDAQPDKRGQQCLGVVRAAMAEVGAPVTHGRRESISRAHLVPVATLAEASSSLPAVHRLAKGLRQHAIALLMATAATAAQAAEVVSPTLAYHSVSNNAAHGPQFDVTAPSVRASAQPATPAQPTKRTAAVIRAEILQTRDHYDAMRLQEEWSRVRFEELRIAYNGAIAGKGGWPNREMVQDAIAGTSNTSILAQLEKMERGVAYAEAHSPEFAEKRAQQAAHWQQMQEERERLAAQRAEKERNLRDLVDHERYPQRLDIYALGLSHHFNQDPNTDYHSVNPGVGVGYTWLEQDSSSYRGVQLMGITYSDSYGKRAIGGFGGVVLGGGQRKDWHAEMSINFGYLDGSNNKGPVILPAVGVGYANVTLEATYMPGGLIGDPKDEQYGVSAVGAWLRVSWQVN